MPAMNVNEMTFGVEIECYLPAGTVEAGGYHSGLPIAELPAGWNAQRDGSLVRAPRGYTGVEIVSPILKGVEGLNQIKAVCAWIVSKRGRVNDTCGLHVHVGWTHGREQLKKLIHLAANFEKAIYAATGTKSRERGSYSRPISDSHEYQTVAQDPTRRVFDRYHVLNCKPFFDGRPEVEFRAFASNGNLRFE